MTRRAAIRKAVDTSLQRQGVCSTDILVTESKNASGFGFVLAIMSSDELVRHADSVSTGTKMPRCNWTDLARYEIVIPPDPALEEFNRIAKPMINVIVEHVRESHTLANIRNTLLPKLLSGDIRVSDAEKLVGTAT